MNELFAPAERLSHEATHFFVDLVFGGGLLVLAVTAALIAFFAWSRARRLSAEVWHRHGLRAGPISLTGTVIAADDDEATGPIIELTITQTGKQYRGRNGNYIHWTEVDRKLSERPFVLLTDGGDKVHVVPGGRIDLVDRLEDGHMIGTSTRIRQARISATDIIWLRGELRHEGDDASGPYRGGKSAAWTLRPPARGALFVSSEPSDADPRRLARRHGICSALFLAALLVAQGGVFSELRALRTHGVTTQGTIQGRDRWRVRTKQGYSTHYSFTVAYDPPGEHYVVTSESNGRAYNAHVTNDPVPLTYLPARPNVFQIGALYEVGASFSSVLLCMMALFFLTTIYLSVALTRPWWRHKKVNERVAGTLL